MQVKHVSRSMSAFVGSAPLCAVLVAAVTLLTGLSSALADPLTFTLVDQTGPTVQSKIGIVATATLTGTTLTEGPQFAPGGLNGNGSETSLYKQTTANTPSNMVANVYKNSIMFPSLSTAQAGNATGALSNNLAIVPAVGGGSGSAAADYGVVFSSPQSIAIPSIDLSSLGISGLGTLNLGTLSAINLNVALRNFEVNMQSGSLPLTVGGGVYPTHFDSTQVNIGVTGTADVSLTATLKQDNLTDFVAVNAALLLLNSALSSTGVSINTSNLNLLTDTEQIGFGFTAAIPTTFTANGDASQGTLEHVGSNLRLTMPVAFNVTPTIPSALSSLIAANFAMSGTLIGTTPFVVVPEPSSVAMAATGLLGMLGLVWRRRRSA